MANVERKAAVVWEGDLFGGNGSLNTESSNVLQGSPVTWAARTSSPEGKTSPEELIAGAHASCFAMALSLTLAQDGNAPERLEIQSVVTFDDEAAKVTASDLHVRGEVPGLDAAGFEDAAKRAEDLCPISNALRNNVEIRLHVDS